MSLFLPQTEEIYFSKTREYFQEVLSSYSIGNYRSATVMLYSVAICDILFKLQELKDMFNDTIAEEILQEVDKSRNEHDNKSKSRWEKELIDNVYRKTKLLDLEAYTNLNHLYDHRNFSAHPALNENYELVAPSKETTIANIKNVLKDILIKPPIFIKNIVSMLTEDLKGKNTLYQNEFEKLSIYLNNKYYSRMPQSMKFATLRAFWKFCFCLPEDPDCVNNLAINRKALEILIEGFPEEAILFIKNNNNLFPVANNEACILNLIFLLSKFSSIFSILNLDTQLQVNSIIEKENRAKAVSWFRYKNINEHIEYLKKCSNLFLDTIDINYMSSHYSNIGESSQLIDFFIWYFGESGNYDSADYRFSKVIEPFLDKMNANQFEKLIEKSDTNRQIWDRGLAYKANTKVVMYAKKVLNSDFDYSEYTHFRFNNDRFII